MGIGGLLALDSEPAHWWLYPLARVARGRRGPRWIKTIKGNKAAANQSPLLRLFYEESRSKRTTTRQQLDCLKTLV